MRRFFALCLFLAACAGAQAQGTKPLVLVASPALQGLYSRTALIAVPAGEGHIGFIVNRATQLRLGALFTGHAPSAKVLDPVHFGGPERADALFAIVRRNPGAGGVPLFDGLYLVANADALDRVIEQAPSEARFFAGFVAWQPGELASELEAGYWHAAEADPELFFRRDTAALWEELIERLGRREWRIGI